MTEYIAWYEAGAALCRCLTCGALVSSADTETHSGFHEDLVKSFRVLAGLEQP